MLSSERAMDVGFVLGRIAFPVPRVHRSSSETHGRNIRRLLGPTDWEHFRLI